MPIIRNADQATRRSVLVRPIESDVAWPTSHVKQVLHDLVNESYHDFQHGESMAYTRIYAHEVLVQPSLMYPAQSVSYYIDRYEFPADVQYPPKFLNEWENAPPLRSVYGDSARPDINTSTKNKGSFRYTMVQTSYVPPSSQESSDTGRAATLIRDTI